MKSTYRIAPIHVPEPTWKQVVIDWIGGVVGPIACLVFDPIIFGPGGEYRNFTITAYVGIIVFVLVLTAWLLFRPWPSVFAGLLYAGSLFAMCIGVLIFPLTLIGLIVGIGIFGLTPFLTAWVFLRNA